MTYRKPEATIARVCEMILLFLFPCLPQNIILIHIAERGGGRVWDVLLSRLWSAL